MCSYLEADLKKEEWSGEKRKQEKVEAIWDTSLINQHFWQLHHALIKNLHRKLELYTIAFKVAVMEEVYLFFQYENSLRSGGTSRGL